MFFIGNTYKPIKEEKEEPNKDGTSYHTCIHCKQEFSVYSIGNRGLTNVFDTCIGCTIDLKKDILNADTKNQSEEKEEET